MEKCSSIDYIEGLQIRATIYCMQFNGVFEQMKSCQQEDMLGRKINVALCKKTLLNSTFNINIRMKSIHIEIHAVNN